MSRDYYKCLQLFSVCYGMYQYLYFVFYFSVAWFDDSHCYVVFLDCPQVQCIKRFNATEPDELGLEESDVINVFKKMADGRSR